MVMMMTFCSTIASNPSSTEPAQSLPNKLRTDPRTQFTDNNITTEVAYVAEVRSTTVLESESGPTLGLGSVVLCCVASL